MLRLIGRCDKTVKLQVGQTANAFKARLGCYSEPLYVFAKGLSPLMSLIVRYGADLLIPQEPGRTFIQCLQERQGRSLVIFAVTWGARHEASP
jgi:hypothetical protein